MNERADPLGLDLSAFTAKKKQTKPSAADIRKVAENASFPSREAAVEQRAAEPSERRDYRTGRNIHFSCKVTQETSDEIYSLTDELARRLKEQAPGARWTVGMTVERMVAALKRELAQG
jgi:hypothetical protein